jgi:serine/threonine-protein kinase
MAPEVVTGEPVGPAADLYALGAVGYYLLTGQRLFDARTVAELVVQQATATPIKPSARRPVPADLEAVVMRCLEKAPSARFGSARELGDALAALEELRDWNLEEARRWWRDFVALEHAPDPSEVPTMTVTIDLDQR